MVIHLSPNDNFDRALSLMRDPKTEFVLKKGERYKTQGNWAFSDYHSVGAEVILHGEGARLCLENPIQSYNGIPRKDRDLGVLWCGHNATVENLILDGNEKLYNNPDPSKAWYVAQGLWGSGTIRANNVTVENIRGAYSAPNSLSGSVEAFAFGSQDNNGGSVFEECKVQNCPEDSYISCFQIGHDNPVANRSTVKNCTIDIGKNNWFGFGVNCNVDIINCEIKNGVRNAVYNDTGRTSDVRIKDCTFSNIEKALSLIVPNGHPGNKGKVLFRNSVLKFSKGAERHLVELWDKNTGVESIMGCVYFVDCAATCEQDTKLYVACAGKEIREVVLINCLTSVPLVNTIGNKLIIL